MWVFAIILQIACSISFVLIQGYKSYGQRDLMRTIEQAGEGRKIVFLRSTYQGKTADLTRNPPVLSSAQNVYIGCGWNNGPERGALLKRFPGREVFIYDYPGRLYRVAESP
jgi:hypothetical protein